MSYIICLQSKFEVIILNNKKVTCFLETTPDFQEFSEKYLAVKGLNKGSTLFSLINRYSSLIHTFFGENLVIECYVSCIEISHLVSLTFSQLVSRIVPQL